ncbi:hypothetical protein Ngar_c07740 [Candidatus Nitrososphaera gargensis Ga9.2]|uniref:Uncharacterized protein n=1 Tax=Nitrososphaera gargensis (strain Ga9.2) TaxID=1237085 RepID=K0I8Y1_NITGG|nr:hypothetical protein Ngar_c07740 [Candidatus Nitrososphaera gargensis Ga9.2]
MHSYRQLRPCDRMKNRFSPLIACLPGVLLLICIPFVN